jgi:hypothetical protein
MASLNSLYIKKETLETLVKTLEKKGDKGVELTMSINDEGNEYFQNVSAYVSQSKEQRENKSPRFYVGNGNTFWTDGVIEVVKKPKQDEVNSSEIKNKPESFEEDGDDLPF